MLWRLLTGGNSIMTSPGRAESISLFRRGSALRTQLTGEIQPGCGDSFVVSDFECHRFQSAGEPAGHAGLLRQTIKAVRADSNGKEHATARQFRKELLLETQPCGIQR